MKFILLLTSIIYLSLSNFYCLAKETKSDEGILKVGLIVPLSGRHQEIGKSVLNSIRLALSKINNDQIEIFPKDNYSNPEKTLFAARQLEREGIQMVIGPITIRIPSFSNCLAANRVLSGFELLSFGKISI